MHHVAIMKKSWKLVPKILEGTKTAESRWYKTKRTPWNKIEVGDTLYFKESSEPVTLKTIVTKVNQYEISNNHQALEIMNQYARADLGLEEKIPDEIKVYILNKKYAILVFFDHVEKIKPFEINKTGFGLQAAWLTVKDIDQIKL